MTFSPAMVGALLLTNIILVLLIITAGYSFYQYAVAPCNEPKPVLDTVSGKRYAVNQEPGGFKSTPRSQRNRVLIFRGIRYFVSVFVRQHTCREKVSYAGFLQNSSGDKCFH
ncbi:hypothetical protein ACFLV1_03240 [Chloroflexota bacterium]